MAKKILLALLAVLVIIQFFGKERSNPVTDPALDFIVVENVPDGVATAVQNSCYDCHSNKTVYPWYSRVAPVSWMISSHVKEGRDHLNFSEWGDYPQGRMVYILKNCFEEIDEGEMPLPGYRVIHAKTVMNSNEREEVLEWLKVRGNWD